MYETIFEKGKATDRRIQELRTIRERIIRQIGAGLGDKAKARATIAAGMKQKATRMTHSGSLREIFY